VAAVAVPVFDLAGKFRGALAVSGLNGRLTEKARRAAVMELSQAADRLRKIIPASDE
jgi:DNA-binding IclR family transcriptional regulator